MSHIFISYSRSDIIFAGKIVQALADNKLDTWIDWKSIPKGEDWEQEIYRGIEEADAFLFLISPDSVASQMCNKEIAHAVKNGKRILPIVIRDTDPKIVHPEISKRNWIFCRDGQDDFNKAIEETRKTIHTDYEWLKFHTELQVKALKWEQKKDNSRLLRGKELREADDQLAQLGGYKDPQPTDLQRLYVLTSRRHEERQRRQLIFGLITGFLIILGIAIVAVWQWQRAEERARDSLSRQLAAQSQYLNSRGLFDLSFLLAVEAVNLKSNETTYQVLWDSLGSIPITKLRNPIDGLWNIAISHDGQYLAQASWNYEILVWDIRNPDNAPIILSMHQGAVTSFVFSPDDHYLVSGSKDSNVILWDMKNPTDDPFILNGHDSGVTSLTVSSDGHYLISGDQKGTLLIWDMKNLDSSPISLNAQSDITSITVAPNGEYFIAGNREGKVLLWYLSALENNPKLMFQFRNAVTSLAFSKDGKYLASGDYNGEIVIANVIPTVWETLKFDGFGRKLPVTELAFSPNGQYLAIGTLDHQAWLVDMTDSNRQLIALNGHSDSILAIAFSPDGLTLATGDGSGSIQLWNMEDLLSGSILLQVQNKRVMDLIFSPDGKILFSGNWDYSVDLWDRNLPVPEYKSLGGSKIYHVTNTLSPDGRYLARGDYYGAILIWDLTLPDDPPFLLRGYSDWVSSLIFSPDSNSLVSGSRDGNVLFWDLENLSANPTVLYRHNSAVASLDISLVGKYLASASIDGEIAMWNIRQNSMQPIKLSNAVRIGEVSSAVFSPDGHYLVAGSYNGKIILWNVEKPTEDPISLKQYDGQVWTLAFSPDSKYLAVSGNNDNILIYDLIHMQTDPLSLNLNTQAAFSSDGRYLATIAAHNVLLLAMTDLTGDPIMLPVTNDISIDYLAFSPDGRYLAGAGSDIVSDVTTIFLWDVRDVKSPPIALSEMEDAIFLSFTPDSSHLVVGSSSAQPYLLSARPEDWVTSACKLAQRNITVEEWAQYLGDIPYEPTCSRILASE